MKKDSDANPISISFMTTSRFMSQINFTSNFTISNLLNRLSEINSYLIKKLLLMCILSNYVIIKPILTYNNSKISWLVFDKLLSEKLNQLQYKKCAAKLLHVSNLYYMKTFDLAGLRNLDSKNHNHNFWFHIRLDKANKRLWNF